MTGDFHLIKPPHKHEWFAHLLNFIFPGVGLLYWRRDTLGLYWLGLSLTSGIGLICLWMIIPFLPQLLGLLLLLYWFWAEISLFGQVRSRPATQITWSRGESHLSSFFGLSILCLALITLTVYIAMTRVYSFVYVQDMSMYPNVLTGDILLVDRRLYEERDFKVGEVIVYDSVAHGMTVSRVVASAQEAKRVEVLGAQVTLDEEKLHLQAVDLEIKHLSNDLEKPFPYQQFYLEHRPLSASYVTGYEVNQTQAKGQSWIVSEPIDPNQGRLSLKGQLGKNTLLVLPDMRQIDNREWGSRGEIIDRSRVVGRPIMIVQSSFPHPYGSSRRGLMIR